ncbi:penicillin-binding protein 2 [Halobacteriovorax sp. GB3]|uniref:penicillin-binding protein 2 n=1 Tax=Halobacteriovorax sp. GB3 TaxID=2719615 RepID=UPI0023601EE9|nr:penicillin-binding protein 2 [Halobacteriovorax sp. GB3]MDD0852661.1 penicillin-binding protein 2 [Halobacteriovorax sp. GB3]
MFGEDDIVKSHKTRADVIYNLILLCFLIIVARLWYLQIYQGDLLYKYSVQNRLRKEVVKAPRGLIYSRNNQNMVNNVLRFDAVIIPQYLTRKKETIERVAKILSMSTDDIKKVLKKNRGQARYRPVVIKKNVSQREVAVIETENSSLPGVRIETFISREYRDKEVGGHLLGYISEISQQQLPKYKKRDGIDYNLGDFIGQSGVEERYDQTLRGEDGYQFMEVDARGRMKRVIRSNNLFAGIENKEALPGDNIRLTIDRDMQLQAYKSLEGKVGSVVAIDVETGEVLTMVSRPSFDPSRFSRGITTEYWNSLRNDERRPLRDRTIQEHYMPGSTFKPFVAIAALEEGIFKPEQKINCKPTFKLGRRTFHDWKRSGHGMTDVVKSLKRSVDVYYYKIGTLLDIDVLADYAKSFGLGSKTGVNLPRETSGLIPTKEWKKKRFGEEWQLGETVSCSIGQSYVLTTPIQLAVAYAAIANGGRVYKPKIIKEVFSNNGRVLQKVKPELVGTAKISKETLKWIKQGLNAVVNEREGTAWWHRGRGIRMAGKTGTAQVRSMSSKELFSRCKDMPMHDRHHGVFAGFAPYENPKIAVAVVVEHGCSGSSSAAPVMKDVATVYMKKYQKELYEKYAAEDKQAYLAWLKEWREKRAKAEDAKKQEENEDEDE